MNAKEALNIVANATGHLQGTRKDHEVIAQALAVLEQAIAPAPANQEEVKS